MGGVNTPSKSTPASSFPPPLPYLLPAWLMGSQDWPLHKAMKGGQYLNILLSMILTFTLLRLLRLVDTPSGFARLTGLMLLGMLPIYYRTFAYVRGEPFVAVFSVLCTYQVFKLFHVGPAAWGRAIKLGLSMGLLALSRQWGMMLFPAYALFAGVCCLRYRERTWELVRYGAAAALLGVLTCGWFYWHLYKDYGSITAFNEESRDRGFALSNRGPEFLSGRGDGKLFTKPYRGSFDRHLFPVFHADTWGDYWGYFAVYGRDLRNTSDPTYGGLLHGYALRRGMATPGHEKWLESNVHSLPRHLGRVMVLAFLPLALWILGLAYGVTGCWRTVGSREPVPDAGLSMLAFLGVAASLAGYFWWLMSYHTGDPSSVKSIYMIQIYPMLAVLGALAASRLAGGRKGTRFVLLAALAATWLMTLPASFSRFTG
jgi:hypothetical protein